MNADAAVTQTVPETITLPPPEMVTAHPLHWLFAFPYSGLVLLMPRRFGPRAIESGWFNALLVHFLSLVVFIGCMASYMDTGGPPTLRDVVRDFHLWDEMRRPFTGVVTLIFLELRHWQEAVAILISVALGHFAFWAAAVAVEPFVSIGETRWHAYTRAVRALLWATACIWPMGWILPLLVNFFDFSNWVPVIALFAWLLWWCSVVIRIVDRYAGPQRGARFDPRPVLCEECGYTLANLPVEGRCPECGREIAASLPSLRQPSRFAAARNFAQRCRAFPAMLWQTSRSERFLAHLPIWSELRAARRFSLYVAICIGLLTMIFFGDECARSNRRYGDGEHPWLPNVLGRCVAWFYGFFAAVVWMLLTGLFASKLGFAKTAPRGAVICYASGFLILPALLLGLGYHACRIHLDWNQPHPRTLETPLGPVDKQLIVCTALLAPFLISLLISWLRVRHMLRAIRFANA